MERVAFLVEETGERLSCLLNPESVVIRRSAGIRPRSASGGQVAGERLSDDPLLYSGGGRTEVRLDLLFDVSLPGSTIRSEDVRNLTRPLWNLAENDPHGDPYGRPPAIRFVWGKAWNVPAVVAAVAERLERFSAAGVPGRSWLRMQLLRRPEARREEAIAAPAPSGGEFAPQGTPVERGPAAGREVHLHRVLGGGSPAGGERIDHIAARYYGVPDWRPIARASGIANPLDLPENVLLRVPEAGFGSDRP